MKRILQYLLVFLFVFTASAGTMIFAYKLGDDSSGGAGIMATITETEEDGDPILDGLVSSVLSVTTIDADINLAMEYQQHKILVAGQLGLNLSPLALDADVVVTYNGKHIEANIILIDNDLYISVFGQQIVVDVSNLGNDLQPILELVLPYIQSMDLSFLDQLGLDLEHFDVTSLTSLLNYITTAETEEGYSLTFAIPNLLSVSATLDKNYRITSVTIPTTTISGVTFGGEIALSMNSETFESPKAPEGQYLNVTSLFDLVPMVLGYQDHKTFAFDIAMNYQQYDIIGQLVIDMTEGIRAQFVGTIAGIEVSIVYTGDVFYVTIASIKVQATMQELIDILSTYLPTDNLDWSSITLVAIQNIIQSIDSNDDQIMIDLGDHGVLILGAEGSDLLTSIAYHNTDINVQLTMADFDQVLWLPVEGEYVSITVIESYIVEILEKIQQQSIAFHFDLSYADISLVGDVVINWQQSICVQVSTRILGLNVDLTIEKEDIYLTIDDVHVKTNIDQCMDLIQQYVSLNVDEVSVELDMTNLTQLLGQLTIATWDNNELSLVLGDLFVGVVRENNKIQHLDVVYGDLHAELEVTDQSISAIDYDCYLPLESVTTLVDHVMNIINNKTLVVETTISLDGAEYEVDLALDWQDDITLQAETTIEGFAIKVTLIDGVLYANIDDICLSTTIDDIESLLTMINGRFGLDLNKIIDLLQQVNQSAIAEVIDIEGVFGNITTFAIDDLQLTKQNDQYILSVGVMDCYASLTYTDHAIKQVWIAMDTIGVDVVVLQQQPTIVVPTADVVLNNLLPFVDQALAIVDAKAISGNIELEYAGIALDLEYAIDWSAMTDLKDITGLKASIRTNFYGLPVHLTLNNHTIYANVAGLAMKAGIDEIPAIVEYINETFDQNIDLEGENVTTTQFSLDWLTSLACDGQWLTMLINNQMNLALGLADGFVVDFTMDDLKIKATVGVGCETITVGNGLYVHYSIFTRLLDSILAIMDTKQMNIVANATVYEGNSVRFNADCQLDFDFNQPFAMFGDVQLTGEQNMEFGIAYDDQMWYINYDKLKVKMSKNCLSEIAVIVCQLLGIDASSISFLQDVTSDMQFDMDNLQQIIPSFDPTKPLTMLELVQSITFNENILRLVLNGAKISGDSQANDIVIDIVTFDGELSSIVINDFYTGVTHTERFDLTVTFQDFEGVKQLPDSEKQNYMDVSAISGLVKAFVNTSSLTDFHITANLDVKMEIVSIDDAINMSIPVDIAIKLVDKKPQILATLGPIPVIAPIDNDVPYVFGDTVNGIYCGLNRILKVYFVDGYVYFYRSEDVPVFASSDRKYEKMLKVTLEEFLSDPMMLLSYGCGFKDLIMDEINKAVSLATNRETPINMSNILLGFAFDQSTSSYRLVLNLEELANNPDLDTLTLTLTTGLVNGKEYLTKGVLDVHMPIADAFKLDLVSDDLTLVNIGTSLNFAELENFVGTYPYKVDERWEASKGNWKLASAVTYTIAFEENGGAEVNNIVGAVDTEYTLPTYEDRLVATRTEEDTYRFVGWYTSPTFEEGTLFTATKMTKGDKTLYAKWEVYNSYRTIFYYVEGSFFASQYALVGSVLNDYDIANVIEYKDGYRYTKQFSYWGDASGNMVDTITCTQDVYAYFEVVKAEKECLLTIDTVLHGTTEHVVYENDSVQQYFPTYTEDVVIYQDGVTTTYRFAGWYVENTWYDFVVVEDTMVTASWEVISIVYEREFVIIDNGTTVYTTRLEANDTISIPTTLYNTNTLWYTDQAFTTVSTLPNAMPDHDVVLYIRNQYTLIVKSVYSNNGTYQYTMTYYQGENVSLPTWDSYYLDDGTKTQRDYYTFVGYDTLMTTMPNEDVVINATWQTSTKYYYTVTFDMSLNYIPYMCAAGSKYKTAPPSIASIRILEGETLDLTQSTYQVTCKVWATAIAWGVSYNYKSTTWGTSKHASYANGGDGFTSIVITGDTVLYPYWEKQ